MIRGAYNPSAEQQYQTLLKISSQNHSTPPPPAQAPQPYTNDSPYSNSKEVKLFVWTDSNGRFLKPGKFWKTEGMVFERSTTIRNVQLALDHNRNTNIGCILISYGVNDIERVPGAETAKELVALVHRVQQEHPSTKGTMKFRCATLLYIETIKQCALGQPGQPSGPQLVKTLGRQEKHCQPPYRCAQDSTQFAASQLNQCHPKKEPVIQLTTISGTNEYTRTTCTIL